MNIGESVTVFKLGLGGEVLRRYDGQVVARGKHHVVVEAVFTGNDFPIMDLVLKHGDRFVETFYDNRGYNVFEIYDRDTGALKGWYCNLSRAATLAERRVEWVDLALDLWVWPDGRRAVLDQGEFDALPLDAVERAEVRTTLRWLERAFELERPPT